MPDIKISALPAASALDGSELLPIVQNGSTKKVPIASFDRQPLALRRLSRDKVLCEARVAENMPAEGAAVTIFDKTGAGTLTMVQITLGSREYYQHCRLQIFVDNEAIPSVNCDLGTLLLTAYDATGGNQRYSVGTEHIQTAPGGTAYGNLAYCGGMFFPVPYGSRCVVKLYRPAGVNPGNGNVYYSQVAYRQGLTSQLRLRSHCVPLLSPKAVASTEQDLWIDRPNGAGWLVYAAQATKGNSNYQYLERQQWFAVDDETYAPNSYGAIFSSFSTSGGEDFPLNGWYFAGGLQQIVNPWVLVTTANNGNGTAVFGVDLLGLYGGIRFDNRIRGGWSLKDKITQGSFDMSYQGSYTLLYYIDSAVPFAPVAPQGVEASLSGSVATITVKRPKSSGSQSISSYAATFNGSAVAVTIDPNTGDAVGTVNGVSAGTYSVTATATNSVGTSPQYSGSVTVSAAPAPPSYTNLVTSSGGPFNAAPWNKLGGTGGATPTVTDGYADSPRGTANAARLQASVPSNSGTPFSQLYKSIALPSAGTYNLSFWVKGLSAGQTAALWAEQNGGSYTNYGKAIFTPDTGGAYVSVDINATTTSINIAIGLNTDVGAPAAHDQAASCNILIDMAQVTAGSGRKAYVAG